MRADINKYGSLIITIGYNFSSQLHMDQIKADEQTMILLMQGMIGKPFRNQDNMVIGKVIDIEHINKTVHFYVKVEIDSKYKDILLAQLQMSSKQDFSMSDKHEKES